MKENLASVQNSFRKNLKRLQIIYGTNDLFVQTWKEQTIPVSHPQILPCDPRRKLISRVLLVATVWLQQWHSQWADTLTQFY